MASAPRAVRRAFHGPSDGRGGRSSTRNRGASSCRDGSRVKARQKPSVSANVGPKAKPGPDLAGAFADFRACFKKVHIDIATGAPGFKAFKADVGPFFRETNPEAVAEWDEARRMVRAGQTDSESLPRETADRLPRIRVTVLSLQPRQNPVSEAETGRLKVAA